MQKVIIVDDDPDIRLALVMLLSSHGYQTVEAETPEQLFALLERMTPAMVLLDMNFHRDTTSGDEGLSILRRLSAMRLPVVLITAWASIDLAVKGMQLGALDFIEKPWNKQRLLSIVQKHLAPESLASTSSADGDDQTMWVAESQSMKALESMVRQIAPTDANVLILGENGTGKSALAKRIHALSKRNGGPFVSVNMATVPENLFESELFGHRAGAFTDAKHHRQGRIERAATGTLFLDEIGTMPVTVQPKLLRVLETGEYEVLGASQTQRANVRLISATNADLNALIEHGAFRRDLLFRLNTFALTLPPLRSRPDDIALLAMQMITAVSKKYQRPCPLLTDEALVKLKQHSWPGNVRELSHVIERAVLLSSSDTVLAEHLMLQANKPNEVSTHEVKALEDMEKELILLALEQQHGNVTKAADVLGISRNALYRRMEKFGFSNTRNE